MFCRIAIGIEEGPVVIRSKESLILLSKLSDLFLTFFKFMDFFCAFIHFILHEFTFQLTVK
jgi:hypothetical protein